jgi:hypothetical protein
VFTLIFCNFSAISRLPDLMRVEIRASYDTLTTWVGTTPLSKQHKGRVIVQIKMIRQYVV